MKLFSIILSLITFLATSVFLIFYFPDLRSMNGILYFAMMLILLLVCVTGLIINLPTVHWRRRFKITLKH